jgi:replication-associated recombination protein RarA
MRAAGSLLTRHRPQTFAEMIGQDDAIAALKTAADNGSHAFLLVGPSGVGKTTLARIGATHLHADQFVEIDAATASGADDMRELTRVCDYRLTGTRAIIIDEAHRLSPQAWTTLAKPIEEPPEGLIWFLCTTDPDRVPDHIQTRCTPLRLHDVGRNQLITLLEKVCKKERWKTPTEVLALCAQYALGSPRRALLHLATCSRCEDRDAAARLINAPLSKAAASDSDLAYQLARELTATEWPPVQTLLRRIFDAKGREHPEGVRQVVRGYFTTVVLTSKDQQAVCYALRVLDHFAEPLPDLTTLMLAVGRVVFAAK